MTTHFNIGPGWINPFISGLGWVGWVTQILIFNFFKLNDESSFFFIKVIQLFYLLKK
jgi:hypothetical protein